MDVFGYIRVSGTILSLLGYGFILYLSHGYLQRDTSGRMIYTTPMITWAFHGFMFYLVTVIKFIMIGLEPTAALSTWSVVVRLHGITSVIIMLYFLNKRNGKIATQEAMNRALKKCNEVFEEALALSYRE